MSASALLKGMRTTGFSGGLFMRQQSMQPLHQTVLYLKKSDYSKAEWEANGMGKANSVPRDSDTGIIRAHDPNEGKNPTAAKLKQLYDSAFNGGMDPITPVYLYTDEASEVYSAQYTTYGKSGRVTQKCDGLHVKERTNDQGRLEFPKEPITCGMASGAVARLMGKTNTTGDPDVNYVKSIESVQVTSDRVLVTFKTGKTLELDTDEFMTAFSLFGKCGLCGTKLEVKLHLRIGNIPTVQPITFLSHSPYDHYSLAKDLQLIESQYLQAKTIAPDMDLNISDLKLVLYRKPEVHRAVVRWSRNQSAIGNMTEKELYVAHIALHEESVARITKILELDTLLRTKRFDMAIQQATEYVLEGKLPDTASQVRLSETELEQRALTPTAASTESDAQSVTVESSEIIDADVDDYDAIPLESIPDSVEETTEVAEETQEAEEENVSGPAMADVDGPTENKVQQVHESSPEPVSESDSEVSETDVDNEYLQMSRDDLKAVLEASSTWSAIIGFLEQKASTEDKGRQFVENLLVNAKSSLVSKYGDERPLEIFSQMISDILDEPEDDTDVEDVDLGAIPFGAV